MITRLDVRRVLEGLDERVLMELMVNPVDALCDRWDYRHYNTFRRLARAGDWMGFGPGFEGLPGNRRGRGHADPDKRGLAAVARDGDDRPSMIRHPCNTLVGGPSRCGKSTWTSGFLRHADQLMHPPPRVHHYCFGAWQPAFDEMKKYVQFHEGLPTPEDLDQWFGPTQGGLLVLDDLMEEGVNDKRALHLFSKQSHHRNISVLFLCQNLFPPGKFAKTISRNAHYIVAFKNPWDQVGIAH